MDIKFYGRGAFIPENEIYDYEFITGCSRNSGYLDYTKDRGGLKRQLHANRGKRFEVFRKTQPGEYKLIAIIDRGFPLPEYKYLDEFIDQLLS